MVRKTWTWTVVIATVNIYCIRYCVWDDTVYGTLLWYNIYIYGTVRYGTVDSNVNFVKSASRVWTGSGYVARWKMKRACIVERKGNLKLERKLEKET